MIFLFILATARDERLVLRLIECGVDGVVTD